VEDYTRNAQDKDHAEEFSGPMTEWAGHGSRAVACFLFVRSEAVTVGSNPTQDMDV
jgi:hypothetical protein